MALSLHADPFRTMAVLNRLLRLHATSLPSYLVSARPFVGIGQRQLVECLQQMARDHEYIVDAVGRRILEQGGTPEQRFTFSMEYTDLHDLSVDYVGKEVLRKQEEFLLACQACVQDLAAHPACQSLAYEAEGMARGHLELLRELCQSIKNA